MKFVEVGGVRLSAIGLGTWHEENVAAADVELSEDDDARLTALASSAER
jgi:aryl-alcohol dehydrogenase-like predicted oxidoreductase